MSGASNGGTRFEAWVEEEFALLASHGTTFSPEAAEQYREALGNTLRGCQLKLADAAEAVFDRAFGDEILTSLTERSDRARDHGLREFFRRFW